MFFSERGKKIFLLSMPLVDGFNVSEDHSVFSFPESFGHRDFRIFRLLRLLHVLDVLAALVQIVDVDPLRFEQLLKPVTSLFDCFLDFDGIGSHDQFGSLGTILGTGRAARGIEIGWRAPTVALLTTTTKSFDSVRWF